MQGGGVQGEFVQILVGKTNMGSENIENIFKRGVKKVEQFVDTPLYTYTYSLKIRLFCS